MLYSAIVREIHTRLKIQSEGGGLAEGLKIRIDPDWSPNGVSDMPRLVFVDITSTEGADISGRVGMFLFTSRTAGVFNLAEWVERVMDAIETSPKTGEADLYLTAHTDDGEHMLRDGRPVTLIDEAFTWDVKMSEITDLSFCMQLEVVFSAANQRAKKRRDRWPTE